MPRAVIDVEAFLRNLEGEFEVPPAGGFSPALRFRDLGEWTSLQALIVVASFERDYGVTLTAAELDGAQTFGDLHTIVTRHAVR